MNLNDLNKKQREAVLATDGPLLILAGAGSGKTRVLTTKVAYLVLEKNIRPYNILAITFTNKAAFEMKERVHNMLGDKAKDIQISTFHSFGLKIIRENYELLGYDRNFSILDSDDSVTLIRRIFKDLNIDPKVYNIKAFKNKISSLKNDMMLPDTYERYVASEYEKTVLKVYRKYQELLVSNNSFDFDDLLLKPLELLEKNKSVLERYQDKYRYILIDEYQDTNEPQYLLTKLLAKKHQNICVVGDADQSIFSWRGANYKNILNFEKDYPNVKEIVLDINYRSVSNVLEAANDVIKNNVHRKEKNLTSIKDAGEKIRYFKAYDQVDEANYVTRQIKTLIRRGEKPEEIAILYRTNAQSRVMEEALLRDNIPYKIIGGINFYSRKEIKDLVAYLKLIYNPKDEISFLRIINVPKRGIGPKALENLREEAIEKDLSLFEAISSKKMLEFQKMINDLIKISDNVTLTELIDKVLDVTKIKEEYQNEKTLEADIRLENLEEFKSITKAFESNLGLVSLEDFLYEISLVTDIEDVQNNRERVNLMTLHAVKGLEFNNVFIVGFEEGLFPHVNSLMDMHELEEERRLAYVGITRAKENLYFVNARRRMFFGREQNNLTSRFIEEIREDLIEKEFREEKIFTEPKLVREELFHEEEVIYEVGDFVYHDVFGSGRVIEVTGSIVTATFPMPFGVKKLIKNHKSLRRIE